MNTLLALIALDLILICIAFILYVMLKEFQLNNRYKMLMDQENKQLLQQQIVGKIVGMKFPDKNDLDS